MLPQAPQPANAPRSWPTTRWPPGQRWAARNRHGRPAAEAHHLEAVRQVEVELDGGALPPPPDRVLDLDVDLGAVEGPAALVHLPGDTGTLATALSASACACRHLQPKQEAAWALERRQCQRSRHKSAYDHAPLSHRCAALDSPTQGDSRRASSHLERPALLLQGLLQRALRQRPDRIPTLFSGRVDRFTCGTLKTRWLPRTCVSERSHFGEACDRAFCPVTALHGGQAAACHGRTA